MRSDVGLTRYKSGAETIRLAYCGVVNGISVDGRMICEGEVKLSLTECEGMTVSEAG